VGQTEDCGITKLTKLCIILLYPLHQTFEPIATGEKWVDNEESRKYLPLHEVNMKLKFHMPNSENPEVFKFKKLKI
jgi:hypothetical protein